VKQDTDATVFDTLYQLFGIGDFDGETEWHQWRRVEIARIKACRVKRGVDPFQLVEAAHYCRRRSIWIKAHWQLYEHLPAVAAERLARARSERTAELDTAIAEAIQIEADSPDSPWFDQLVRATGQSRQAVFDAWQQCCTAQERTR
jgi:hypothetical protein